MEDYVTTELFCCPLCPCCLFDWIRLGWVCVSCISCLQPQLFNSSFASNLPGNRRCTTVLFRYLKQSPHFCSLLHPLSSVLRCNSPSSSVTGWMKSLPLICLHTFFFFSGPSSRPRGFSSCVRTPRRRCWRLGWPWGNSGWCRDKGRVRLREIWCIWIVRAWSAWVYPQ